MLSVCTSSTETQLAKLGDLMTLLGATASSSGMDLALTQGTSWVERYITNSPSGTIRREVVLETLAGSGSQRLMAGRTPLLAIQRFFDSTATCSATEYCSTDYRIENAEAGFVEFTNDSGFDWDAVWQQGITMYPKPGAVTKRWMLVYEAGWQLTPSTSTSEYVTTSTQRTLPDDIERAVLLKAADLYENAPSGLSSLTVGPLSANFGSESIDPVMALLAPYRRLD